ncbi:unnamed protein product [Didymodactylos carnosus]|uniref:Uncharacterized protein n=1 Tax=Didymodactylos carnosus TaxID=1234261 RepID=A0A814R905_9BILA|nr:unnamed protein product [Didymodactylos carnosus]CAF3894269.1 unnamed protein product [Didymodactylos carnosus]
MLSYENLPHDSKKIKQLHNGLERRLRRSLQQFLGKRLKSGCRRPREYRHHLRITGNKYNYLKIVGITSQFIPQMIFFTSVNVIVNLVYGQHKDRVSYVSDFECKVRKNNPTLHVKQKMISSDRVQNFTRGAQGHSADVTFGKYNLEQAFRNEVPGSTPDAEVDALERKLEGKV